jgi:hypothetical protein
MDKTTIEYLLSSYCRVSVAFAIFYSAVIAGWQTQYLGMRFSDKRPMRHHLRTNATAASVAISPGEVGRSR